MIESAVHWLCFHPKRDDRLVSEVRWDCQTFIVDLNGNALWRRTLDGIILSTCLNPKGDYVYRGRKFNVRISEVTLPTGIKVVREIVEFRGAVAILPILSKDKIILIKQYRPVINEWIIEVPAGTLEEGEDPASCALRELEEEIGYRAGKLIKLFEMFMSPGYSTEKLYAFIAMDLVKTRTKREKYEVIEEVVVSLDEAISMVKSNVIRDAKTIALLLYYKYVYLGG